MTEPHICVMKEDVKEMTTGVRGLTTDMALVKKDVMDLKTATLIMSECIKELTEASIVSQQTSISREKFYEKLDELGTLRTQALIESTKQIELARKEVDARIDVMEKNLVLLNQLGTNFAELRKWVMGIVGAIILFAVFEAYRILVK